MTEPTKTLNEEQAKSIRKALEIVGMDAFIEAISIEEIVELYGAEKMVQAIGVQKLMELYGAEKMVQAIGGEKHEPMICKKILCIGDIVMDILPSIFPVEKARILEDGESFVNGIQFQRGGCAGNFVAVLKSVFPEFDVHFVSRIGVDFHSDFLVQEMENYQITHHLIRDPASSTPITIAVAFNDGERHFLTNLGALNEFCAADIDTTLLNGVDHLAYRGIWFAEKLLKEAPAILKKAKEQNIPVSMDLGFDPYWEKEKNRADLRKGYALACLPYVDVLFGNQQEFLALTNKEDLRSAFQVLFEHGAESLVLHKGKEGAEIIRKGESSIQIPPYSVDTVNPVGSGDTFDSVFIGSQVKGLDLKESGRNASAGAALSISTPAGTKIRMNEIKAFQSRD